MMVVQLRRPWTDKAGKPKRTPLSGVVTARMPRAVKGNDDPWQPPIPYRDLWDGKFDAGFKREYGPSRISNQWPLRVSYEGPPRGGIIFQAEPETHRRTGPQDTTTAKYNGLLTITVFANSPLGALREASLGRLWANAYLGFKPSRLSLFDQWIRLDRVETGPEPNTNNIQIVVDGEYVCRIGLFGLAIVNRLRKANIEFCRPFTFLNPFLCDEDRLAYLGECIV